MADVADRPSHIIRCRCGGYWCLKHQKHWEACGCPDWENAPITTYTLIPCGPDTPLLPPESKAIADEIFVEGLQRSVDKGFVAQLEEAMWVQEQVREIQEVCDQVEAATAPPPPQIITTTGTAKDGFEGALIGFLIRFR